MEKSTKKVGKGLKKLARGLEEKIAKLAGMKVPFTLIVYTPTRANLIHTCSVKDSIRAMKQIIKDYEEAEASVAASIEEKFS